MRLILNNLSIRDSFLSTYYELNNEQAVGGDPPRGRPSFAAAVGGWVNPPILIL